MKFLRKLTARGENTSGEHVFGELRISPGGRLAGDPDARMEEFWVEVVGTDPAGYWVLVGRRYGQFQLYNWSGDLYRLPSRPPSRSVTDVVFTEEVLCIAAPPHVVLYSLTDPQDPGSWKAHRISGEGVRPIGGLDAGGDVVAFAGIGERIHLVPLNQLEGGQAEPRGSFSFRGMGVGDLKSLRILPEGLILLGGSEGTVLCTEKGEVIGRFDWKPVKPVLLVKDKLILADTGSSRVLLYDYRRENLIADLPLEHEPSSADVSPDGGYLFTADSSSNRLGVYDLRKGIFLGFLEGYGYGVVKVSADGTLYTTRREETEEGTLYILEKLETNLLNFLFPPERQREILRGAEGIYRRLRSRVRSARREEELESVEELEQLRSVRVPLPGVRELVRKAEEEIREKRWKILTEDLEEKLRSGTLKGSDLEALEERIEKAEEPYREALEKLKAKAEDHLRERLGKLLEETSSTLKKLEITHLPETESLPEVRRVRDFVSLLPRRMQEEANRELQKTLHRQLLEARTRVFTLTLSDREVRFGRESFPRFRSGPRRLRWRFRIEGGIVGPEGPLGRVIFEREDGLLLEPRRFGSLLPEEELRRPPPWVGRYLRKLNALLSEERSPTPEPLIYEPTPWFVQNLERFTALVREQLEFGEGILILEGDTGVGKNFLVEVFASLTGRPLFTVACNSRMEKEDVTYLYEFDPKRGTRRVYSDLVRALRTPGAIVYFDEINTLPPSLVKMFNPLFDYRRRLILPQGEAVRAHREVLLVGGMNPQNYLGVSELPQDIKSRADVLYIDYPPFQKGDLFYPDEAMILRSYLPSLARLGAEDFLLLWNTLVNDLPTDRGERLRTPEREEEVRLLFELLKIASRIRTAYRLYQTQQSEEPVEFVFSLRDSVRCARRLRRYRSAKRAVLETVIPKISSSLEKEIVADMIERV